MRLSGVGGSVRGFSSGEALLIGGRVYFGWLNSGETVFTGAGLQFLGCPPVKGFLAGGWVPRWYSAFKAAIHNLRATQ